MPGAVTVSPTAPQTAPSQTPQSAPAQPTPTYEVVLKENGLTQTQWNEIMSYWTPKVNDPSHPASAKFRELAQKESDRIFGIKR